MSHRKLRSGVLLLAAAGLAFSLAGCGDLSLLETLHGESPGELRFSPTSALVPEKTDFTFSVLGGFAPYTVGIGATLVSREGATWVFPGQVITGQSELFTIQATDLLGNAATAEVTVYAVPAPLALDVTEVTLIAGGSWTFHASGGSGPYSWSVDEVPVDHAPVPDDAYTYTSSAEGSFMVTVTDSIGLSQSATVTVKPNDPGLPLEITPLSVTVELNGTAIFSALGGAGSYAFEVLAGGVGGIISTSTANSATYTAPSAIPAETVTDVVELRDGAGTAVTAKVIVINPAVVPLSLYPQNPTVPGIGSTLQFQGTGGTGPGTYTFSSTKPQEGRIDPQTGFYKQVGVKNVQVIVTDASGATASTVVKVK
jgi:hypothetical protein